MTKRDFQRFGWWVLLAIACLGLSALASIAFGARVVGLAEIWAGISGQGSDIGALAVAERLPRTAIALCCGACLGVSGALMQAVTRNPIADPGILGVNTGASLAVVSGIAFAGLSSLFSTLWVALLGATLAAGLVYTLGSLGPGGTTPIKLALAGVATTAALSSVITIIRLPRAAGLDDFRFWAIGSLGRGTWQTLLTVAPFMLTALLVACACASALNSLALGDEMATALGVSVARTRLLAAGAGVTLCAVVTAVAGPISFVGLLVSHVVRLVVGPDQRRVLPLTALVGAALLTGADTIGRIVNRPDEIAVGIITAFLGAPVLIYIVRTTKVREL
ncbi:FecCD family ABC transporter permease [Buchananella hordeovulneris]|uniref:FecCD family ABC transporter permease n=1 Tax=Buchananella hordeovulneris TaxID=52770 RepID=UPI001FEED60D|nr:iron ABC transporter permease [Buchananella hordeovulneris]